MRVDLYLHIPQEVQGQIDDVLDLLHEIRSTQIRQGGLMSAAFDALNVEIEEIKASVAVADSKLDELRQLLKDLGGAPTEEQIAEATAKLDEAQKALQGKVDEQVP